jgi:hypothetical protein
LDGPLQILCIFTLRNLLLKQEAPGVKKGVLCLYVRNVYFKSVPTPQILTFYFSFEFDRVFSVDFLRNFLIALFKQSLPSSYGFQDK